MLQLKSKQQLSEFLRGDNVGFVPTMGALHVGHVSLIKQATAANDCVIVSIFVNPLQFDNSSDLQKYPNTLPNDINVLLELGVDAVYLPQYADLYPEGDNVKQIVAGPAAQFFEGEARPGHFDGMLTVVHRLLKQVNPSHAYFGEKDAQQLCLVKQLVDDFALPVEIVGCRLVRDADGLAVSSRNVRLSTAARHAALSLPQALRAGSQQFESGVVDASVLVQKMMSTLDSSEICLRYCAIVDDRTFAELKNEVRVPARAIIAAEVGGVHLLDNQLL